MQDFNEVLKVFGLNIGSEVGDEDWVVVESDSVHYFFFLFEGKRRIYIFS